MSDDMECPPLPPARVRHRGHKIDMKGRVSALCFSRPRAIDLQRATWVMRDDGVTCPKCRALIEARNKTPNAEVTGKPDVGTELPPPAGGLSG